MAKICKKKHTEKKTWRTLAQKMNQKLIIIANRIKRLDKQEQDLIQQAAEC